jgi:hypothetical protein
MKPESIASGGAIEDCARTWEVAARLLLARRAHCCSAPPQADAVSAAVES